MLHVKNLDRSSSRLDFEKLETRRVLSATAFVDFGAGLSTETGLQISDMQSSDLNGPQVFGDGYLVTTLESQLSAAGFTAEQSQTFFDDVIRQVQVFFDPFDVTVQRADSADLTEIGNTLQSGVTNDAYIFVGGNAPETVTLDVGSAVVDQGNLNDNLGFVFSEYRSVQLTDAARNIAAQISKQVAHTFGAQGIEGSDARSDGHIMAMQGTNSAGQPTGPQHFMETFSYAILRRILPQSLELGVSPGMENTYDVLAAAVGVNTNTTAFLTMNGGNIDEPFMATLEMVDDNTLNFTSDGTTVTGLDITNGLLIKVAYRDVFRMELMLDGKSFDVETLSGIETLIDDRIQIEADILPAFRHGSVAIYGGDMADTFYLGNTDLVGYFTGGGDDTITVATLRAFEISNIRIDAGPGDDTIKMLGSGVFVEINGGEGHDTLDYSEYPQLKPLGLWNIDDQGFDFKFVYNDEFSFTFEEFLDFEAVQGSETQDVWIALGNNFNESTGITSYGPIRDGNVTVVVDGNQSTFETDAGQMLQATDVAGVYGHEIFVRSSDRFMRISGDFVQVSSDIDWQQGNTESITDLRIAALDLLVSNMNGDGLDVTVRNTVEGATAGLISFDDHPSRLGIASIATNLVIHGSNTEADRFLISSTQSNVVKQITLNGNGGDDRFEVGADLDVVFRYYTMEPKLLGGSGTDSVVVNDRNSLREYDYRVTDTGVADATNGLTRGFTEVLYAEVENVRVTANVEKNVFRVAPSPDVQFRVDGRQPGAGDGDSLVLIRDAAKPLFHVPLEGQNHGVWYFGNAADADKLVIYDSVEYLAEANRLAVGSKAGSTPVVRVYNSFSNQFLFDIIPYESGFRGGVQVETADMNGDSVPDIIVSPGRSRLSLVKVFSGRDGSLLNSFYAFPAGEPIFSNNFIGGVDVAVGNVLGDSSFEIVASTLIGRPDVRIFVQTPEDYSIRLSYNPFPDAGLGAVRVETGDFDNDGIEEIVSVPGLGLSEQVAIHSYLPQSNQVETLHRFIGYTNGYRGGNSVATGDINGDGFAELLLGSINTGSAQDPFSGQYRVLDGATLPGVAPNQVVNPIDTVQAFDRGTTRGVSIATRDMDRNGIIDRVFATPGDPNEDREIVLYETGIPGALAGQFEIQHPAFQRGAELG